MHEAQPRAQRIDRLESAITEAIQKATPEMRAVTEAWQALRGVAHIAAVTVVAELGCWSRFQSPRQRMGYSGLASSEYSSGHRPARLDHQDRPRASAAGHRESDWAYQHRPWIGGLLLKRQRDLNLSPAVQEIAWKAQWSAPPQAA